MACQRSVMIKRYAHGGSTTETAPMCARHPISQRVDGFDIVVHDAETGADITRSCSTRSHRA